MHSGIVNVLLCGRYCCKILQRFTETLFIKIMSGKFNLLSGFYKCIFVLSDLCYHIYFYRFV